VAYFARVDYNATTAMIQGGVDQRFVRAGTEQQ